MRVELSPEARRSRLGSKGLLLARLDKPSGPRRRTASKQDLRASPVITVALYGPDDDKAGKLVIAHCVEPDREPDILERWTSEDVLEDVKILEEARAFIASHPAPAITITEGTVGCPHEEGKDFPLGGDCPACPFWNGKQ